MNRELSLTLLSHMTEFVKSSQSDEFITALLSETFVKLIRIKPSFCCTTEAKSEPDPMLIIALGTLVNHFHKYPNSYKE